MPLEITQEYSAYMNYKKICVLVVLSGALVFLGVYIKNKILSTADHSNPDKESIISSINDKMLFVVGHANPDTDSVVSAISVAYLYKQFGYNTTACRQGSIAPETAFVLKQAELAEPVLLEDTTGKDVILVDFSDKMQAPPNIEKAYIHTIIDHHKLRDLTTDAPLEMWVRPIGCTATIVYGMYKHYGVAVPKNIAKAILSDTVLFKSVTTTKADKEAVQELNKIAEVKDPLALGMEMFDAKSTIKGATPDELIHRDYKDFLMNGKKVGIGQLEVVDLSKLENMHEELRTTLQKIKEAGAYHSVLFFLTDIMKEEPLCFVASDDVDLIEQAFNNKLNNDTMCLQGIMSRKKQIVPVLQRAFAKET